MILHTIHDATIMSNEILNLQIHIWGKMQPTNTNITSIKFLAFKKQLDWQHKLFSWAPDTVLKLKSKLCWAHETTI